MTPPQPYAASANRLSEATQRVERAAAGLDENTAVAKSDLAEALAELRASVDDLPAASDDMLLVIAIRPMQLPMHARERLRGILKMVEAATIAGAIETNAWQPDKVGAENLLALELLVGHGSTVRLGVAEPVAEADKYRIEVFEDGTSRIEEKWGWRLLSPSSLVVATGDPTFPSAEDARQAAVQLRSQVAYARIEVSR